MSPSSWPPCKLPLLTQWDLRTQAQGSQRGWALPAPWPSMVLGHLHLIRNHKGLLIPSVFPRDWFQDPPLYPPQVLESLV